jgi:hypothetical protein
VTLAAIRQPTAKTNVHRTSFEDNRALCLAGTLQLDANCSPTAWSPPRNVSVHRPVAHWVKAQYRPPRKGSLMSPDDSQDLDLHPSVEVRSPDGESSTIALTGERATVGRLPGVNDIVLAPDPDRYVSGKWHCLIELEGRVWRVVDNASLNGTLLRRGDDEVEVRKAEALSDGDVIRILARLSESAGPSYWELVFRNPVQTMPAPGTGRAGTARLEYERASARLFRIVETDREELANLPPQVHRLLRYLLERNRANDDMPVLCSHDELMEAIWGDDPLHSREELNGLIFELRRRIELVPGQPRFVQTVRGLGFRLDPRPTAP